MSEQTVNVFIPTTPNPTSGFLLFCPNKDITYLDMSVEDAVKLVVSGGLSRRLINKQNTQETKCEKHSHRDKSQSEHKDNKICNKIGCLILTRIQELHCTISFKQAE